LNSISRTASVQLTPTKEGNKILSFSPL